MAAVPSPSFVREGDFFVQLQSALYHRIILIMQFIRNILGQQDNTYSELVNRQIMCVLWGHICLCVL